MSKAKAKVQTITVPNGFEPRDYQQPLLSALDKGLNGEGPKKALLVWPRQIGKDTTCFAYMCKRAVQVPGNYFYIFPTQTQAREALWTKVTRPEDGNLRILSYLPGYDAPGKNPNLPVKRLLDQSMYIELYNGSTIKIEGLEDNPEKIRGITPTGVVFSEFAFSHPDGYKSLQPSLRGEHAWMIINSTPNGRNHFYDMAKAAEESDNWFFSHYQALWPEKPDYIHIHGPEYFDDLVKEGISTWDDIEREYGCSFQAGIRGSYYTDQIDMARESGRIGTFTYNNNLLVDTFWDIGSTDDAPVWFRQMDGNRIVFPDYCDNAGKSVRDYVALLADKGYRYGVHYLPHDAGHKTAGQEGRSTAEIFEDLLYDFHVSGAVHILPKCAKKQTGINAVRSRFSRYHFDEDACHLGLKHVEGYSRAWDRHNKVFRKEPKHDEHSHAADALRYEAESGDDGPWERRPTEIKVLTGLDLEDL